MTKTSTEIALPVSVEETRAAAQAMSRALRRAARQARAPASLISGGNPHARRKSDRYFRIGVVASFVLFALVPLIVMSVYWGLVASPQYSTEAKFAVRTSEASVLAPLGADSAGRSQVQDIQIVPDYLGSSALVARLDKALDLRRVYSRSDVDYFSRFAADDSTEDLTKFWQKHMDASIDRTSGVINVNVRAFTPEDSLAVTKKIIEFAEELVNDLSTRSRLDALNIAKGELKRAQDGLIKATLALRDARNAEGVLDAVTAGEALNKLIMSLRANKAQAEVDLATMGPNVQDSPTARVLRTRIASFQTQIDEYLKQVATSDANIASPSMASRADVLARRNDELNLAQQYYAKAAAAVETARVDLEGKRAYLAVFLAPSLAQKPTYPLRWWHWAIVVVPCFLAWGVLLALALQVRDHMAR